MTEGTEGSKPTVEPSESVVREVKIVKKILVNIGKVEDWDLETMKVEGAKKPLKEMGGSTRVESCVLAQTDGLDHEGGGQGG